MLLSCKWSSGRQSIFEEGAVMGRFVILLLVLAVSLSACGADEIPPPPPERSVIAPKFPLNSTMDQIQKRGKLKVGIKFNQPGFGQVDSNNQVQGFDAELASLIAQELFGGTKSEARSKINFIETVPKNREPFIQNNEVDIVIATYS